jgi:amino acid adenylation domain-containing protein
MSEIAKTSVRITNANNADPTLSAERRELMALLLKKRGLNAGRNQVISRRRKIGPCPLSFAQQRLWLLDQLNPGNPAYNMASAVRLAGPFSLTLFDRVLSEIVRRHESLRTSFPETDGQAVQVISTPRSIKTPAIDLSRLPARMREAVVRQSAQSEHWRPFDLARGPLLRVVLFRIEARDHIGLFVTHHIISDGWSQSVFIHEFSTLWNAFDNALASPLSELPIQYADFALWQRERLQETALQIHLDYWKKRLLGCVPLNILTDQARPSGRSFQSRTRSFAIGRGVSKRLASLARQEGTTLFALTLACFQLLLHRYSGQEDIVVGSPVAGRDYKELEGLIGCFANQVALRTSFSAALTFRELLKRTRETVLEAFSHQDLPFERLVEELAPERRPDENPIFQVSFAFQNIPQADARLQGLGATDFELDSATTRFDLEVHVWEGKDGIGGILFYSRDLFPDSTAAVMVEHFLNLLTRVSAQPDQRIPEISLLTEQEINHLAVLNQTTADVCLEGCLHELFEEQVRKTPEAIAAIFKETHFTYGGLNSRSNRLAGFLRQNGIKAEMRIGLCFDRSIDLLVAILAVSKAGGAYVPIDPSYPADRISLLLTESGSSLVFARRDIASLLPAPAPRAICPDEYEKQLASFADADLEPACASENLIYVIYTSGSTGKPKGVMITHRGLINYLVWSGQYYHADQGRGSLVHTSAAFDLTITSLLTPLIAGQCVILLEQAPGIDKLREAIEMEVDLSYVKLTPAHLKGLNETLDTQKSWGTRALVVGGEALRWQEVEAWRRSASRTRIINEYGPTETIVGSCCYEVGEQLPTTSVPIGRPIANTQLYILDSYLSYAPMTMLGELFIGGDGVARGYLGRPDLTAEKFLPNPSAKLPGARMYQTGDLVRFLPSGDIEFVRRRDHEVKIRGFRVDPGEIEVLLSAHPNLKEAVVLTQSDRTGDNVLAAYVVPKVIQPPERLIPQLRSYLEKHLPDYLRPSLFYVLSALPLTANGKLDRSALALLNADASPGRGQQQLQSVVAEIIAGVWAEVLGLKEFGAEENFFELGGHSLLGTQVISRLRKIFMTEVALRDLFEAPTVAALAKRIEVVRRRNLPGAPPLVPSVRNGPPPLSFAQQRLWFLDRLHPNNAAYHVPLSLRLSGALNIPVLKQSLESIVRRHEVLRTALRLSADEPVQVILEAQDFPLLVVDLGTLNEIPREFEARRLASEEAGHPFDLTSGPLVRATLLKTGQDEYIALFTLHHIVCDGWSLGIFGRELTMLYEAGCAGAANPLPPLPLQYADFAVWQRQWLQGAALEEQLAYWQEQLAGKQPVLNLPCDYPRPPVPTYRGELRSRLLGNELREKLLGVGRQQGGTIFIAALAAFLVVLRHETGQDDLIVGTDVANRNRAEIEGLIGFFVNQLVLRTRLSGDPTFTELLSRVRETALGAYDHQDLPFEMLVNALRVPHEVVRSPLFQVSFTMANAPSHSLELPGVVSKPWVVNPGTAKLDWLVTIVETREGLFALLEYSTDLFEASTIDRILKKFEVTVRTVISDPHLKLSALLHRLDCEDTERRIDGQSRTFFSATGQHHGEPIGQLRLFSNAKRRRMLADINETPVEYDTELCIHEWIEEQARKSPETPAVIAGEACLSYRELDRLSNCVARRLRRLGVGPDSPVGLLVERSIEMLVSLVAILKAGGAYVPLSPAYPKDRIAFILADAGIRVVLTRSHLEASLQGHGLSILRVDMAEKDITEDDSQLPPEADPDNPAYIIYTSGATGLPKGVLVSHRNLVHSIRARAHYYSELPDNYLLISPFVFDSSVAGIFWTLTHGGSLVLIPDDAHLDLSGMVEEISRRRVSHLLCLPTLYSAIIENANPGRLSSLRMVIVAGEACPAELTRRHYELLPMVDLYNEYGPTETTVWSTVFRIPPGHLESSVPIGRPIANTKNYILDSELSPVPVGAPGELCIAGWGVARGYLNRPDFTAERFLPDPWSGEPGARLYRSGDSVRCAPDGNIHFVGRLDHQVKILGHRIELGEIETVLEQHRQVERAVVTAREDQPGEKRLAAYVIPRWEKDTKSLTAELSIYLKQHLPNYMVPATIISMPSFPLNTNGKVDRAALPAPTKTSRSTTYLPPRNDIEERLVAVWADVLQLEQVGINDNFFDLGGQSLSAVRLQQRLIKELGREIRLLDLFQYPSVSALAEYLSESNEAPALRSNQEEEEWAANRRRALAKSQRRIVSAQS